MTGDTQFAFQRLDIYRVSRELMVLVVAARIRDVEFRDQATRAVKSQFLNISEGLPSGTLAKRRKYFEDAQRSLFECVAAVDGGHGIEAIDSARVGQIMPLSHRVDMMLRKLMK